MINYDGYGFVLCMMCPTSFPSPTQLHLTPPYPATCTVTSPWTPLPYHTREVMLQHFHNPGKMSRWALRWPWKRQSAGGGGRGAGGKLPKCLATAARAINFCVSPEKVASGCVCVWGGGGGGGEDSDTFPPPPTSNICPNMPWPTAELTTKEKQTNKNENHRRGGQIPPCPPWRCNWVGVLSPSPYVTELTSQNKSPGGLNAHLNWRKLPLVHIGVCYQLEKLWRPSPWLLFT